MIYILVLLLSLLGYFIMCSASLSVLKKNKIELSSFFVFTMPGFFALLFGSWICVNFEVLFGGFYQLMIGPLIVGLCPMVAIPMKKINIHNVLWYKTVILVFVFIVLTIFALNGKYMKNRIITSSTDWQIALSKKNYTVIP